MEVATRQYAQQSTIRDVMRALDAAGEKAGLDPRRVSSIVESAWISVYKPKIAKALELLRTRIPVADLGAKADAILRRRKGWLTFQSFEGGPRLWTHDEWDEAVDRWFEAVKEIKKDASFASFYYHRGGAIIDRLPSVPPGRYSSWNELTGKTQKASPHHYWLQGFGNRCVDLPGVGRCGVSVRIEKGKRDYVVLQFFPLVTNGASFAVAVPGIQPYQWRLLPQWNPPDYQWPLIKTVLSDAPFEYMVPVADQDLFDAAARADDRSNWWTYALAEALKDAGYATQTGKKFPKGPRVVGDYNRIIRTPGS